MSGRECFDVRRSPVLLRFASLRSAKLHLAMPALPTLKLRQRQAMQAQTARASPLIVKALLPLIMLIILMSSVLAAELSVEKKVSEKTLEVGGSATVELSFDNPFSSDVAVQISDRNVLGNNGLEIECMEFSVRPGKSTMQYDPIDLYSSGDFALDSVVVNYTDPDTGNAISVSSEELDVTVKGTSTGGMQGIKKVYQCNGVNMQSTSFSSSGMQNQQQQSQQQQQQSQSEMQQKKNAVQNNQMDQDAGALKQEMQNQRDEFRQQQQEIAKQLQEDPEFQKQDEALRQQGYNLTSGEIDPESNNTGNFKMNYERPDGETASLSGRMENGSMQQMSKQSSEMEKQMMQQLMQDERYQNMSKQLAEQGFNQTDVKYDLLGNQTQAQLQYERPNGQKANITADFVNSTVTDVRMEKEEETDYKRIGFFAILIAMLLAAAYLVYRKYFRKNEQTGGADTHETEKPVDYRKESRKMLDEARKLFGAGKEKDAYELVGRAVRFYYTHKLGYRKELTNTQTIKNLREHKLPHSDVQKCLNMCGMVEFAKYKANRKDFDIIFEIGESVVKK
ncbi:hypothetical protein KY363_03445 [Candidatus Woesearchaeota archaeon]|nr:hypothetical protein [Candidatus Woesearchaeota archaeon]